MINGALFLNGRIAEWQKLKLRTIIRGNQMSFDEELERNIKPGPCHPGEILEHEFLIPLELSSESFAKHLGWSLSMLNEVLEGNRGISHAMALQVADALGTSPELWLNLQTDYDLWHAKQSHRKISAIRRDRPSSNHNSIRP